MVRYRSELVLVPQTAAPNHRHATTPALCFLMYSARCHAKVCRRCTREPLEASGRLAGGCSLFSQATWDFDTARADGLHDLNPATWGGLKVYSLLLLILMLQVFSGRIEKVTTCLWWRFTKFGYTPRKDQAIWIQLTQQGLMSRPKRVRDR